MTLLLNIIWFMLIGWGLAFFMAGIGLLLCLTIIGIPLGLKCFSLVSVLAFPLGRQPARTQ